MFLEIPEYKDVESRKANKQQKSKCTRQIDYLNSWNGKQSTRFRSSGKQLKNPRGRQRPIISGGIRCSLTSPSSLFAFFARSLGSAAVKCLECFFAQLWSVFLFEKAPGGSSSSSATEYEEAGHTAGPEIVPFPSSSCASLLLNVGESLTCYRHLSSCCCRSSCSHAAAVDLSQEDCFGWRGSIGAGG